MIPPHTHWELDETHANICAILDQSLCLLSSLWCMVYKAHSPLTKSTGSSSTSMPISHQLQPPPLPDEETKQMFTRKLRTEGSRWPNAAASSVGKTLVEKTNLLRSEWCILAQSVPKCHKALWHSIPKSFKCTYIFLFSPSYLQITTSGAVPQLGQVLLTVSNTYHLFSFEAGMC